MSARRKKSVAAIILAAGDSHRIGSPKALLTIGSQTFLNKLIADYRVLGCQPIIAVAGKHFGAIRDSLTDSDVLLLRNPDPDRGAFSSLQLAVQNLPPACDGFFIHPVDHPAVKLKSLRLLLSAWFGEFQRAMKLSFEGRGGHPILLGKVWIKRIASSPSSSNLRELLRKYEADLRLVPVTDEAILLNVNCPDDLVKISPHE